MKLIIAGTEIFVNETDKCIQVKEVVDIPQGLEHEIAARYPDYDVFFLYHNTPAPTERLCEFARLLDDCIEMRLFSDNFMPSDTCDICQVSDSNGFEVFADLHDKNSGDMYWTSSRIKDTSANWGIFLSQPGSATSGYTMILTKMARPELAEIFYHTSC